MLEWPGLQLRWRDAEIGSHTAMRRTRTRQPGNRLFLVFQRKSPPRLLCHLVPQGRYSIYRLVRDPGATSVVLEQRSLVGRQGQQGMTLALGENVTSWHPVSSLLNISLFWTTFAQTKSTVC